MDLPVLATGHSPVSERVHLPGSVPCRRPHGAAAGGLAAAGGPRILLPALQPVFNPRWPLGVGEIFIMTGVGTSLALGLSADSYHHDVASRVSQSFADGPLAR